MHPLAVRLSLREKRAGGALFLSQYPEGDQLLIFFSVRLFWSY